MTPVIGRVAPARNTAIVDVEAVVLAGGASRRMGRDKASLEVGGTPMALRIASALRSAGIEVTVLGGPALPGFSYLPDNEVYAGPIAALRRFRPEASHAYVAACDMPRFDPAIVSALFQLIGFSDACVPVLDGSPQPLCALYRRGVFEKIGAYWNEGGRSVMGWLRTLDARYVTEGELAAMGIQPMSLRSANTVGELRSILADDLMSPAQKRNP
jgi:molybdopterin-guanine dinucleotide biosynthesis protein A